MAALLKSERLPLDPEEVDYTLSVRFKYARHDLVVVDWDGALVFDPEGDVAWAMELLELGNLQLLRYRLLDRELDGRLRRVARWSRRRASRCRLSSRRRRSGARSAS